MRDTSDTGVPRLGDLAVRIAVTAADVGLVAVEAAIRADPAAPGVLTVIDERVFLVDRAHLESVLAGPLGYGRALLHRHPLRDIVQEPALVLAAGTTWDDAARAALGRPAGDKAAPVVVAFDDGGLGVAPIGPLVEYLSSRYAALALRDDLTGLGNRRMLIEHLRVAAIGPATVVVIDLDRFKEINDTLGHARGDELLRHVAGALTANCGPGEAFRVGGDEFVVFTAGDQAVLTSTAEQLEHAARHLLAAIQGPFVVAGVPVTVEAAAGIAHTGSGGLDELLAAADTAMYLAKRDRTQVEVWHPALSSVHVADLGMQTELRTAVGQGELVMHYQPLICTRTRKVAALEALVRWAHPRRGLLSPAAFLHQAERSDVIHVLTERTLADTVDQAARWCRSGRSVPVAVNLAAPVLASDRIVDTLRRVLGESGLPPSALIVEVTESAVMTRPDESADRLRAMRELGVRIAMDDFGAGSTSLALLSRLPLDELKLDRAFVMRIHHRQERVIVEAVARMATGLGLTLVAEGIEDELTAETLTGMGVDLLQGFHLGRPVPAAEIEPRLEIFTTQGGW